MSDEGKRDPLAPAAVEDDPVARQYLQAVMEQLVGLLSTMYPLVAQTNPKRIADAAGAAVRDLDQYARLRPVFGPVEACPFSHIDLELVRLDELKNDVVSIAKFRAPVRLEDGENSNQIFSTATIQALLLSAEARAILYFNGFRLQWTAVKANAPRIIM